MRQIPLKTIGEGEDRFDYREMLEAALFKSPQEKGITYEDYQHYDAIAAALKAAENGTAHLEEADWNFLVNRLKAFRWAWYKPHTRQMIDEIANAPQVKIQAAPETPAEPAA